MVPSIEKDLQSERCLGECDPSPSLVSIRTLSLTLTCAASCRGSFGATFSRLHLGKDLRNSRRVGIGATTVRDASLDGPSAHRSTISRPMLSLSSLSREDWITSENEKNRRLQLEAESRGQAVVSTSSTASWCGIPASHRGPFLLQSEVTHDRGHARLTSSRDGDPHADHC